MDSWAHIDSHQSIIVFHAVAQQSAEAVAKDRRSVVLHAVAGACGQPGVSDLRATCEVGFSREQPVGLVLHFPIGSVDPEHL